jgi:flagellar motor switch protein FliN/FliY
MTVTAAAPATGADNRLDAAQAAARATLDLLPTGTALTLGTATGDPDAITMAGQAVCARFTGSVHGELAVVVAQDLVDALQSSPLGQLDLAKAVEPAMQAAASTLGPVVLDPGQAMPLEAALTALAAKGDAVFVPLVDSDSIRAVVALVVTGSAAPAGFVAAPSGFVAAEVPLHAAARGLDLLHDVEMEVTAELGRTRMSVRELLSIAPGAVVELDRAAGAPTDLLVNGRLIARGEVVVVEENFGLRITEIIGSGGDRSST